MEFCDDPAFKGPLKKKSWQWNWKKSNWKEQEKEKPSSYNWRKREGQKHLCENNHRQKKGKLQ